MVEPIDLTDLAESLALGPHELIALVGGGGKTTLLHQLGRTLPGRVVLTTTTRMGQSESNGFPVVIGQEVPSDASPSIMWRAVDGEKALGFEPEVVAGFFPSIDHLVVEADGARRKPFKAPGPLEPQIPASTTLVLSVIGVEAIGSVIADHCHRPLRVAALASCSPNERLTPERAARVLLSPDGGRRGVPGSARWVVAINKVSADDVDVVDELANFLGADTATLAIRWTASS